MSRQTKTPRQRAEEALALADRKVKRLSAEKAKLAHELEQVTGDHNLAVVRRDYLRQHPDLKATTTTSGGVGHGVAPVAGAQHRPHPFLPTDAAADNPTCEVCGLAQAAGVHYEHDTIPDPFGTDPSTGSAHLEDNTLT